MHAHKVLAAPMGADKVVREFGEAASSAKAKAASPSASANAYQTDAIVFKVLEQFLIVARISNF